MEDMWENDGKRGKNMKNMLKHMEICNMDCNRIFYKTYGTWKICGIMVIIDGFSKWNNDNKPYGSSCAFLGNVWGVI